MMLRLLLPFMLLAVALGQKVPRVGENTAWGLFLGGLSDRNGLVHYADDNVLQIRDFLLPSKMRVDGKALDLRRHKVSFVAYNQQKGRLASHAQIYERIRSQDGEYLQKIDSRAPFPLDRKVDLVVEFPDALRKFTFVGPAYDISPDRDDYLMGVELSALRRVSPPPGIPSLTRRNIIGPRIFYGVDSDEMEILDQRRIRVPNFSFQANIPPDGWFYGVTGRGRGPEKSNGVKLLIEGKDTADLQCSMRKPYLGQDVVVRLPEGLSVYDLRFVGVFCYEVGVDFASVLVNIPRNVFVKPHLPPKDKPEGNGLRPWKRPVLVAKPYAPGQDKVEFTLGNPDGYRIRAMRDICDDLDGIWWANEMVSPEIWLVVDEEYKFTVLGGPDHPLYITSEGSGGYAAKPRNEQQLITNYAGETGSKVGSPTCVVGSWLKPDDFDTFQGFVSAAKAQRGGFVKQCGDGRRRSFLNPAEILINEAFWAKWRGNPRRRNAILKPKTIYYQSYTTFNMGGPIKICSEIRNGNECLQNFARL